MNFSLIPCIASKASLVAMCVLSPDDGEERGGKFCLEGGWEFRQSLPEVLATTPVLASEGQR